MFNDDNKYGTCSCLPKTPLLNDFISELSGLKPG